MTPCDFLNLFVYSDSLAFRRLGSSQDLGITYPFKLKELIESSLGVRTNLLLRGGGSATIRTIKDILVRDTGFLGGDPEAANIAVLQFGIVDCAPRPITYLLSPTLRALPVVGPPILAKLVKHRRGLQRIWSYNVTPKSRFKRDYTSIVNVCHGVHIKPIAVGLPLPPISIEQRSPGFRRNTSVYNDLIKQVIPESFCDIEQHMTESLRTSFLLSDGHHLTEAGHQFYAERLLENVRKLL